MIAARAGRVANLLRVQHGLLDRLLIHEAGQGRARADCNANLRPRKVPRPAFDEVAFGLQARHDFRRQDDDIRRFACPR